MTQQVVFVSSLAVWRRPFLIQPSHRWIRFCFLSRLDLTYIACVFASIENGVIKDLGCKDWSWDPCLSPALLERSRIDGRSFYLFFFVIIIKWNTHFQALRVNDSIGYIPWNSWKTNDWKDLFLSCLGHTNKAHVLPSISSGCLNE